MLDLSENKVEGYLQKYPLYSMKLVNTPRGNRLIIRWMTWILIGLFLCFFLPWQQNINCKGVVTALSPSDRPQSISSIIAGRIEKWYVQEGQFVKLGDTVVVVSEIKEKYFDPELLNRTQNQILSKENSLSSKKKKVDALNQQLSALRQGQILSLSKARNKYTQSHLKVISDSNEYISEQVDMQIAARQMDAQSKLYNKGLKSLTELEAKRGKYQEQYAKLVSTQNDLLIAQSEYNNAKIELNSIKAEYLDKISKCESDINNTLSEVYESEATLFKLRNELTNLQVRNGYYVIKAPQDGYILKASKQGLGELIKEGEDVFTIMPNVKQLAVELYVKPMDMPLIYVGCPIRIQFDGWPALVFSGWPEVSVGTFGGTVKAIDKVSSQYNKFRIMVVPDPKDEKWPSLLHVGAGVSGWAMLNNVMVWYEAWRQFNGFPADFTQDIPSVHNHYYFDKKDKDATKKEEVDVEK